MVRLNTFFFFKIFHVMSFGLFIFRRFRRSRRNQKRTKEVFLSDKILIWWLNKKIVSYSFFNHWKFRMHNQNEWSVLHNSNFIICISNFEFGSSFMKFSFIFTFFSSPILLRFSLQDEKKTFPIYVRNVSFIRFSTLSHISSFRAEHFSTILYYICL